jgi:hypothetical protein
MFTPRSIAVAVALVFTGLFTAARADQTLTYPDLVGRLTDLARLATLPDRGETCAQWSSYDRASRYDEKTGKYVAWDANGDGNGVIRSEGDRVVMAEMKGPGCIWRIWSAAPDRGHVKIYLDDQPEPVLDMPFAHYFDGKHAPLAYPALSYNLADVHSSGQNLFVPIPYQKSCKVVADKGWGSYFHFNYATYPAGTKIPTFSARLAAQHPDCLKAANDLLATGLGTDPAGSRPGQETLVQRVRVAPGQTARVARLDGPRAVTALWVKVKLGDRADQMTALRKLALRITWDGQPEAAVWCPLGDFFGTAPGLNLFKTLPLGMTEKGFYSYWYMPFARSALVELVNEDAAPRAVEFQITHAPLGRPFEGLGYFHTKWHRDTVELPKDRWPDWIMLRTQGRGRFCGVSLHVWNPRGGWWGEGDEKFFVDGEKFPSTFGTGSEDYFGYAWGCPSLFQKPYHCQSMTENNQGHQSLARWHIVENVPFQKSFEACIEKYYPNDRGTLYACAVRWYLGPCGKDGYRPVPADNRDGYYTRPQLVVNGFTVLNEPQGEAQLQGLTGFGAAKWKNDSQLWWTGAQPGAKLELGLSVAASGRYEVGVVLTKARDYGIVQLSLDGKKAGGPVDLFNPNVVPTGRIVLGTYDLSQGRHVLGVEILGANPKAEKSYMFGISQIDLKPAP